MTLPGGIPERLNVEGYLRKPGNGPEKLHHLLEVSHKKGALISCTLGGSHAIEAVNQRLQQRHAYTVIGMTKVKYPRLYYWDWDAMDLCRFAGEEMESL